jgi:thiamine pyrophosphate-dependent acetolactate synthase large subunit-like protein
MLTGDGGLSMILGDLETLARCRLPVTVVVFNDQAYGSERVFLAADGLSADHANLDDIDFAAVARALGIEAATVRDEAGLRAVGARLGAGGPFLVDCKVARDVTVSYTKLQSDNVRRTT